jgi:predicted dienelactone hydrolase
MQAGCRSLEVWDGVQGASVPLRMLYPTRALARPEAFGPFTLELALDAEIEGSELPLVAISHGSGSTPWLHRDLAAYLARAGFAVVLIQHPGNHRGDDTLAGTAINLQNRPRHLRLAIDAAFADERAGARLSRRHVSAIGHSLGGYTVLAAAGGKPSAFASETHDGLPCVLPVERDPRLRALVLLAPATPWFMEHGALHEVDQPILMWTGDKDELADAFHAQVVACGLRDPSRLEHEVVPNAGHFAFVSAYPPQLTSPSVPPSQDPAGFDRTAFLPRLFDHTLRFLRRVG